MIYKKTINYIQLMLGVFCCLAFASCDQDDVEVASTVEFEETSIELDDQATYPVPIALTITPEAIIESEVVVAINADIETSVETDPQESDLIKLPVDEGQTSAIFDINSITNGDGDVVMVEFEIIEVGPGLLANDLEGRFLHLVVQPREENFLFQDDFSNCSGGLPIGWTEEVVMQNSEGSAGWSCTFTPSVEINAFVPGSSDQTNSEVWLISPAIDLNSASSPSLRFEADRRFEVVTPGLVPYDVQIATDFSTQDFETANWQTFEAGSDFIYSDDPGVDGFSQSNKLSLSEFIGETIHIAFVYRAGAAGTVDATILRIRNFEVIEN